MVSCGYACLNYYFKRYLNKKYVDEDCIEYDFFKITCILEQEGIECIAYQCTFENAENNDLLHLKYQSFEHFVILVRKGTFSLIFDNRGYHLVPSFLLRLIFSGYLIKISESKK